METYAQPSSADVERFITRRAIDVESRDAPPAPGRCRRMNGAVRKRFAWQTDPQGLAMLGALARNAQTDRAIAEGLADLEGERRHPLYLSKDDVKSLLRFHHRGY